MSRRASNIISSVSKSDVGSTMTDAGLELMQEIYRCNRCRKLNNAGQRDPQIPLFRYDARNGFVPFGILRHRWKLQTQPLILILGMAPKADTDTMGRLMPSARTFRTYLEFHLPEKLPSGCHNKKYHYWINQLLKEVGDEVKEELQCEGKTMEFSLGFEAGNVIHTDLYKCSLPETYSARFVRRHGDELQQCIDLYMDRTLSIYRPRIILTNGYGVAKKILQRYSPNNISWEDICQEERAGYTFTFYFRTKTNQEDRISVIFSRFISMQGRDYQRDMELVKKSLRHELKRLIISE